MMFLVDYHAGAVASMIGTWLLMKDADMKEGVSKMVKVMSGELHG